MRNLLIACVSILMLLSLDSCTSGKRSYKFGNYYKSVLESTDRLRRSPNNKKAGETLQSAYPLAVETIEQDIQNTLSANTEFKYRQVLNYYIQLNTMHDQIRRSPGALSIIPNPKNYYDKLQESKQLAAKESYDAGVAALNRNNREDAKLAFGYFGYVLEVVPNYQDAYELQQKARDMATLHVLVTQTPLPASFSLSGDYFQNKIEEFVNAQGNQLEFVAFYNEGENVDPNFQPDQIIRMQFDEFSIGNVYLKESSKEYARDSVVLATVQRGNSGNQAGNNNGNQNGGRTQPGSGSYNPEGGTRPSGNTGTVKPGNSGNTGGNSGGNNSGTNPGNSGGNSGGNNSGTNPGNSGGNSGNNNSGTNPGNSGGNTGGNSGSNPGNSGNKGNSGGNNPGNSNEGSEKVEICHKAGNSGKYNTLVISTAALQAHLNHGDKVGPCSEGTSTDGKKAGKSNAITPYTVVSEDGNTEDIYGTVKATLTTFTKTLTSNGLMSMQILDARTNKILREQKYPGEYIWETNWGYYNGDERALTEEQLAITTRKEVNEPTRDEMFAFLSKPIFARVTSDLQTYYKDY